MAFGRKSTLTDPVPCKSPFHSGSRVAASRFVSCRCPSCERFWDVLVCDTCHNRMTTKNMKCKCGETNAGTAWIILDYAMSGPPVEKTPKA